MTFLIQGNLIAFYPHSGHYRPTDVHILRMLDFLVDCGADISEVGVDAQRVYKTCRPGSGTCNKVCRDVLPHLCVLILTDMASVG